MNGSHHVVMYRPAEYALYNSGFLFPIIMAAVTAIVVAVMVDKIMGYFVRPFRHKRNHTNRGPLYRMCSDFYHHIVCYVSMYAGIIAAIAVFVKLT